MADRIVTLEHAEVARLLDHAVEMAQGDRILAAAHLAAALGMACADNGKVHPEFLAVSQAFCDMYDDEDAPEGVTDDIGRIRRVAEDR